MEEGKIRALARRRGFEKERDLVRKLWEAGFATMRAPASGARIKKGVQPDVIAAREGVILCFEVKTRRDSPIYLEKSQISKLVEWAKRAGALPFIAIYTNKRWHFIPASQLGDYEGKCKVGKKELESALTLKDIVSIGVHKKRLDEYLNAGLNVSSSA